MDLDVKWKAPEYDFHEKSERWYYISIVVALLFLVFAIWQRNYLFAFFVVISELMLILWGNHPPETIEYHLSEKGLTIGGRKFYSYTELKGFAESDLHVATEGHAEFLFQFKTRLHPGLKILVPKEYLKEARAALELKLPMIEIEPTILDIIEKLLRF